MESENHRSEDRYETFGTVDPDNAQRPNYHLGRPTKYTKANVEKLLEVLQLGGTRQMACAYAGIGYQTFMDWMRDAHNNPNSPYAELPEMVEQNESIGSVKALKAIAAAQPVDWRAAAWRLERGSLTRQFFGPKQVEVTGKDGEALIPLESLRQALADAGAPD